MLKFYLKLAFNNIKNNRQSYIPFILCCVGTMSVFYLILTFVYNGTLLSLPGVDEVSFIFLLGEIIIALFSIFFIFYANNFLIKRRKKEIGLYSILGLEKKNVGVMMLIETIYLMLITFVTSLLIGSIFGKFFYMLLLHLMNVNIQPFFHLSLKAMGYSIGVYSIVFVLLYIYNLYQISMTNPIMLLKGNQTGEKEPKASIITALLGISTLAMGYYLALSVKDPIDSIMQFFIAVILVIIGTHLIFRSSSVFILKRLKKSKKFYYNPDHFFTVSNMIYRLKQNASGLANICILSTMFLVTLGTTLSLYSTKVNTLNAYYPFDISYMISSQEMLNSTLSEIDHYASQYQVSYSPMYYSYYGSAGLLKGNELVPNNGGYTYDEVVQLHLVTLEEFNRATNQQLTLTNQQVYMYLNTGQLNFKNLKVGQYDFEVKEELKDVEVLPKSKNNLIKKLMVVVPTKELTEEVYTYLTNDEYVNEAIRYNVMFNFESPQRLDFATKLKDYAKDTEGLYYIESKDVMTQQWDSLYGGFFFIGIFMGSIFLMGTALIIYFKQVSEGYNDQERYIILQKVGMSKKEVKKTIRIQILLVFFIPLILSFIHLAFAFNMIRLMLMLFGMTETILLAISMGIVCLIFSIIYLIVYFTTSKVYYKLVRFN